MKATIDDPFVDAKHATNTAEIATNVRRAFGQNLRGAVAGCVEIAWGGISDVMTVSGSGGQVNHLL